MRWAALASVLALVTTPGTLTLPAPTGPIPVVGEAFPDKPDRLKTSVLPGPVDDTERVEVLVGPDGTPAAVTMDQRLRLHGTGQFIVYERSSAQDAEALDDTVQPVLKREAVIWQGFVNGSKDLHARLTLDPGVEAALLPFRVELAWEGGGKLGRGGTFPGPGTLVVRLRNTTAHTYTLPTGDVPAAALADPLDTLLLRRWKGAPPAAGRGLPKTLPASDLGPDRTASVPAPLKVTGTISMPGGRYTGQTSQAVFVAPDGVGLDGVLQGDLELRLDTDGVGALALDLTVEPTVDPRGLTPPRGGTWHEWANLRTTANERRRAVDTLVTAAMESARADEYAPYLGHHGPGTVDTTFHVAVAPASLTRAARAPLRPKPWPLALLGVAVVALCAGGYGVWRRL